MKLPPVNQMAIGLIRVEDKGQVAMLNESRECCTPSSFMWGDGYQALGEESHMDYGIILFILRVFHGHRDGNRVLPYN